MNLYDDEYKDMPSLISSYDTPVKSGYYADSFDTLFVVGEGGLLTEISTCL